MKATGIVRRIDDLGRVVIPKEIRRTMRIREGDPMEIYTDKDGEVIFKKYSPMGELAEFAAKISEALYKTTDTICAICDRDTVISVSGGGKREVLTKRVSPELEQIMEARRAYEYKFGDSLIPVNDYDNGFFVLVSAPIISEGDLMGAIMFLSEDKNKSANEIETKLATAVSTFLGKQMEA